MKKHKALSMVIGASLMVTSMAREGAQSTHYNSELNQSQIRNQEYLSQHKDRLSSANKALSDQVNNLEDITHLLTNYPKPSYEIEDEFKDRLSSSIENTKSNIDHYKDMIRLNENTITSADKKIEEINNHQTYIPKSARLRQAFGNSLGFFAGLGFLTYGMPSKKNKKD